MAELLLPWKGRCCYICQGEDWQWLGLHCISLTKLLNLLAKERRKGILYWIVIKNIVSETAKNGREKGWWQLKPQLGPHASDLSAGEEQLTGN